jgi:hypothetical protein
MTTENTWTRGDRETLWFLFGLALLISAAIVVFAGISIIGSAVTGEYSLSLASTQALPPEADTGEAILVAGTFESAFVTVTGLGALTQGLLQSAAIIGAAAQAITVLAFAYLAWRLLRRRPFLASLPRIFAGAGAILSIGALASQALAGFGAWNVAEDLGSSAEHDFWPLIMTFDPLPIVLGFGLLLIATAFHYGVKLSRDTDGLV